jgi:phosphatidylethanolamine/phosphatidyl-N-methylethanolamine N-methyltransferase
LARFFRSWMQDPLAIGAVAPSSRVLAKLMVKGLAPGDRVVELGAGTGTVTQAILNCGVRPEDLYLIEQNAGFVALLRQRFPRAHVVHGDAVALARHLGATAGSVDFVISGLPLMLFSQAQKVRMLTQAFSVLRANGRFHQFTYAGRCPVSRAMLRQLDLRTSLIGVTALNLPPAFAYRFQRLTD